MGIVANGATFAVTGMTGAPTSFSCTVIEGSSPVQTVPKINDTNLSTTTSEKFIQGKIVDPGEFSATIEFDQTDANLGTHLTLASGTPLLTHGSGTGTLTFPKVASGASVNAKYAGTGFFTRFGLPQLASNGKMTCQITFAFDGQTAPTFTRES